VPDKSRAANVFFLRRDRNRPRFMLIQVQDYRSNVWIEFAVGHSVPETLEYLTELVADKDTTIRHLWQLLLPASEKTKTVLGTEDC
jgi:hypothetical protein